jgi:hypothetical protein
VKESGEEGKCCSIGIMFQLCKISPMSNKDVKKHSISSTTRRIFIKTTRDHFPPVRIAIIKKTKDNEYW